MRSKEILPNGMLNVLLTGTVLALGALGLSGCGSQHFPEQQAREQSMREYAEKFAKMSTSDKFAAQFLARTTISRVKQTGGVLVDESQDWDTTIGNACLDGTAYDTDGGRFSITIESFGWRVVKSALNVDEKSPTALATVEWSPKKPDILRIQAGKDGTPDLVFKGVVVTQKVLNDKLMSGRFLAPANQYTSDKLSTYPCNTGNFVETVAVSRYH